MTRSRGESEGVVVTRSMDGFDALLWQLESHPLLGSGIVGLLRLDGTPDRDALAGRIAELSEGLPRLRSAPSARPHPFALHRWRRLPEIDLDDHLTWWRSDDLPDGLDGLIRRLSADRYDPDLPLWSVHVVTDLPDGSSAVLARLHHAITDGLGAMTMAACFFDADASGTRIATTPPRDPSDLRGPGHAAAPAVEGRTRGSALEGLTASLVEDGRAVGRLGLRAATAAPATLAGSARDPSRAARRSAAAVLSLARLLEPVSAPLSPELRGRSAQPAIGIFDCPLDDLRAAGRSAGGRVNDAYMAALALGVRKYHLSRGVTVPEVRVSMPVNYRAYGDTAFGGNQFAPVRVRLPITASSAAEAMTMVRGRLHAARTEPALPATPAITEALARLPGRVGNALVANMWTRTEMSATNVPGPPVALWCAGRRVTSMHAVPPRGGTAVSTSLLSYDGTAHIFVNMDRGAVADPESLVACLRDGFDEVVAEGRAADVPSAAEAAGHRRGPVIPGARRRGSSGGIPASASP